MEGARLLERLLDIFGALMTRAEHHPVDCAGNVRRVFNSHSEDSLHPAARFLRSSKDPIAASTPDDNAVLRITHDQGAVNILPLQVRSCIEFTGISRPCNFFQGSEEPDLVSEFNRVAPTREHSG